MKQLKVYLIVGDKVKIKVDHIDDDKVVVERFWEKNMLIDEFR